MEPFSKAKNIEFPRSIRIGHGKIAECGNVCNDLFFGKNGIMITGNETYSVAGKIVEEHVEDAGFNVDILNTGNSTQENVEEAIAFCKETKAEFIYAVGGGSKIDIAKLVSNATNLPFVSVPTSLAHDGIASDRASLKTENGAISVQANSPSAIVGDTEVLVKAPFRFTASGAADVLSNLVAVKDWEFAVKLRDEEFSSSGYSIARFAAEDIRMNADVLKPNVENSSWIVLRDIVASGLSMCIAKSSRPTSGSEHMFSHALDLYHPSKALHGEQCGLGAIMMMKLHGGDWENIRSCLSKIGAPVTAKETGIPDEDIIDALVKARDVRKDRFTILGENGLTRNAAEKLAVSTGVIR